MSSRLMLAVALGVFVCAGSSAEAAGDLAAKCKETKAKTAGKKAFDLLKAFGKNVKKPNAAKLGSDVSKAQSKFTRGFSKAENKSGCLTTGDTEAMEAKVDAFVEDVLLSQTLVFGSCNASFHGVEERIDALLPQMTLEEKVEQMTGSGPVDGVWWTADNERLGIPGFGMLDGPRGANHAAGNGTCFPVGMARGATWDPDLEKRVGGAIGTEVRARGASVLLAPTINVLRHPRWGRSQETYGEDPFHLGMMGVGFIRGAQEHVIASPKHFAANSIEDTRFDVNVTVDERTLREIYLPHFKMAVQEGHAGSVMSAYNKVNGFYCGENFNLLREILKGEWGFPGFVESDWIWGTKSTALSAIASLDIEMPVAIYYGDALIAAVQAEEVPEETIDEAVRRILRTKFCFRLDVDPPVPNPDLVETQEHTNLALEVERNAIVLLKNQGDVLPLDRSGLGSIVVVGTLADTENIGDTGSSNVAPSYVITPLEGIQNRAGAVTVTHVPGDPLTPADETVIAAADAAIVVAGLTSLDEGEGLVGAGDREALDLSSEQEQLISDVAGLNGTTIVVLEGGGAIVMENWIDDVEGILMAWYPGQEGGHAIADVLFGDTNPSGKLPITFPVSEEDLPDFDNVGLEVTYDYYHGYRYLDRNLTDPRFPFGYGLSYTTYAYSNLTISDTMIPPDGTLHVGVDVTNTGSVAGKEIVQLYVSYSGSSVDRPVRDLEGFEKVELDPAETKTVTLELEAEDLAYYDVVAGEWVVEAISYMVHVGSSSRDLLLSAGFQIE